MAKKRQLPTVVIGLQWGDEGKGKFIDALAKNFDATVRYNGSNNAGHTVVTGDKVFHFSLIPSAALHQQKVLLSQAVNINPSVLLDEIKQLNQIGIMPDLLIDPRCHVVMPYHQSLDAASERSKGKKMTGSLKLGIGFSYEDRTNRAGIRMHDLINPTSLARRIDENWELKRARVTKVYGDEFSLSKTKVIEEYTKLGKKLKPYVGSVSAYVRENMDRKRFLFEAAQGAFLDFAFGSYPYTVAYHTIASAALADIGLPPMQLEVLGIFKAYTTRVGGGPFPVEQDNLTGQYMRDRGHEYGTVSKRPRRCGWLDLNMIKYAMELNGTTQLALTKLDVLTGLKTINVATGYTQNFRNLDEAYVRLEEGKLKPRYESFPGWQEDISNVKTFNKLPKNCQTYIRFIEKNIGKPIQYISVGPDRDQTIQR